jgi:transcriptional regulator with XRE-family HTH domain
MYAAQTRPPTQAAAPTRLPTSPGQVRAGYGLRVSKDGAAAFGRYLANWIAGSRYPTPTDFARDAAVSPSAVSRWIAGKERPTPRMLERIAPKMSVAVADLVAIAYPAPGQEFQPPVAEMPRVAAELAYALSADSPLTDGDRHYLQDMADRLIDPYRKQLAGRRSG